MGGSGPPTYRILPKKGNPHTWSSGLQLAGDVVPNAVSI
jgi:hypothetical protein